jgi:hypothetical protein
MKPFVIPIRQFFPPTGVPQLPAPALAVPSCSNGATLDPGRREESCHAFEYSAATLFALPLLWWGLRRLGVGQESLNRKYAAIVGLLIDGREMYGRDISRELEGRRVNPGSIYVLLDRLVEAGLLESREAHEPDRRGPRRLLVRLIVPPKSWPASLTEEQVELPLSEAGWSQKLYPLEIEVREDGSVRLHNRSGGDDPVLYALKYARNIQSALPRDRFAIILCERALIHGSDGTNFWLSVDKDRCRLVKIRRPSLPG